MLHLYVKPAYRIWSCWQPDYITHNPPPKTAKARVPKMAADSDDSSSSSDEEAFRRCQEAVWETKTDQHKGTTNLFSS